MRQPLVVKIASTGLLLIVLQSLTSAAVEPPVVNIGPIFRNHGKILYDPSSLTYVDNIRNPTIVYAREFLVVSLPSPDEIFIKAKHKNTIIKVYIDTFIPSPMKVLTYGDGRNEHGTEYPWFLSHGPVGSYLCLYTTRGRHFKHDRHAFRFKVTNVAFITIAPRDNPTREEMVILVRKHSWNVLVRYRRLPLLPTRLQ